MSNADFYAADFHRQVKGDDDCKLIHENSTDKGTAGGSFTKMNVESEQSSSVSRTALYKKVASAGLRREWAMGVSQDLYSSLQEAPEETGHSSGTLHGHGAHIKVRKRAMASKSSDVWCISETKQLPRSLAEFIQIHSDRTAMSLEFNALVAYSLYVVRLNSTERKRLYLFDHGYTFPGFLPAVVAELEVEDEYLEVDESNSFYGRTSSSLLPLENFTPQTSWRDSRN